MTGVHALPQAMGDHKDEVSKVVRVDTYRACLLITEIGKGRCRMQMECQDDPKGNIPKAVVNWAAGKGMQKFMLDMYAASDKWKATHKTKR